MNIIIAINFIFKRISLLQLRLFSYGDLFAEFENQSSTSMWALKASSISKIYIHYKVVAQFHINYHTATFQNSDLLFNCVCIFWFISDLQYITNHVYISNKSECWLMEVLQTKCYIFWFIGLLWLFDGWWCFTNQNLIF